MPEIHHLFESCQLGNERSVWLLLPRAPARAAQLAVFLDAERYRDRLGVVSVIEEQISASALANTLFVFVSEHSPEARWRECPCYPPFARFINEELLPWLQTLHGGVHTATERVLIGLSYTGLAAAYVALHGEGRWTKVISQSGSHWSNGGWLTDQYRRLESPLPVQFHLDIGSQETATNVRHRDDILQVDSQIDAVRHFRDVLRATGHEVEYVEFDGGHDYATWRQTLPGALRWAIPNRES